MEAIKEAWNPDGVDDLGRGVASVKSPIRTINPPLESYKRNSGMGKRGRDRVGHSISPSLSRSLLLDKSTQSQGRKPCREPAHIWRAKIRTNGGKSTKHMKMRSEKALATSMLEG